MKKVISLVMAVVIFLGLFTGYKTVYAATSDLSDYEKEVLNAYLYSISDRTSKWIRPYTYEGIKYDFVNCKEEKLNFNYEDPRHYTIINSMVYSSYGKKYDAKKGMDYLEITGILTLHDSSISAKSEDRNAFFRDDVVLYRVTLGIYIKEIDGVLYAYGEKYKYKDISEKDIVTPEKLTEEEYITFAKWLRKMHGFTMEGIYGLKNPYIPRTWNNRDGLYIPVVERRGIQNLGCERYLPAGWLEGVWNKYSIYYGEDHENPDLTGTGVTSKILKK